MPTKVYTDLTPIPFGKYNGTPMQDVPASYLHWLWRNGLQEKPKGTDGVAEYIRQHLDVLALEHPDGIW